MGMVGIILLIGIVKKNAIMMIDFALAAERGQGLAPLDAIRQGCLLRFRPIMMTTMSALFGAIPLASGVGVGSELRTPLGIAIIGGLIASQVLTLYATPVIYLWFDRWALAMGRWRARRGIDSGLQRDGAAPELDHIAAHQGRSPISCSSMPSIAASVARGSRTSRQDGAFACNVQRRWVACTGMIPACISSVRVSPANPSARQTWAVPSVGWPANGIS